MRTEGALLLQLGASRYRCVGTEGLMVVDDAVVIEAFADVGSKRAEFGVLRKSEPKRRVFAPSEFAELIGLEQDAVKIFL